MILIALNKTDESSLLSSLFSSMQIWNCDKCYAFLHMSCILHWINDSLNCKRAKGITPIWAWYVFHEKHIKTSI